MDIISDYRITSAIQREQQLEILAERSRIADERARLADSQVRATRRRAHRLAFRSGH